MQSAVYTRGLHEVGDGLFAWLQPDGSWGWSNAGLIADSEQSLLVDTLFDTTLTRTMLEAMRRVARVPTTVVNTHGNGDHWYGNAEVGAARIIASRAAVEEMRELPPKKMAMLMGVARAARAAPSLLGGLAKALRLSKLQNLVQAAPFVTDVFGAFEFRGIEARLPDQTFTGQLRLEVGNKSVELIEVGPAHTRGDVVVWVPDDRVVFTGDILFAGAHPIVWAGPVSGWARACRRIAELEPKVVVPGHGPVTDTAAVLRMAEHLDWLQAEASARHAAGMSIDEAARDLELGEWGRWSEQERLFVNVGAVYRELRGKTEPDDPFGQFAGMARLRAETTKRAGKRG